MPRTVYVRLAARVAEYLTGIRASELATRRLGDAIDDLGRRSRGLDAPRAALAALPVASAPAVGAVLSVTGAMASGAAAAVTLGMAVQGMGDALEAIESGDMEALREVLETMPATAQSVLGEIVQLRPAFSELRQEVQGAFWGPMVSDLSALTTQYMPTLQRQLPRVAAAVGMVGDRTADWLQQASTVSQTSRILGETAIQANHLSRAVEPLGELWMDAAEASGPFLTRTIDGVVRLATEIRDMVREARESGQLAEGFETASIAIDQLLALAGQLAGVLIQVFTAPGTQDAILLLTHLIGGLGTTLEALGSIYATLPGPMQSVVALLLTTVAVAASASTAYTRLRTAGEGLTTQLSNMGSAGTAAATGLGAIGRALGWVGIIGTATVLIGGLVGWVTDLAGASERSAEEISALSDSMAHFARTGEVSGELLEEVGEGFEDFRRRVNAATNAQEQVASLRQQIERLNEAMVDAEGEELDRLNERLDRLNDQLQDLQTTAQQEAATGALTQDFEEWDAALQQLVEGGLLNEARIMFEQFRSAMRDVGMSDAEIDDLFPNYLAAIEEAAGGTATLSSGFGTAAANAQTLAAGMQEAIQAGSTLLDVFNQLHGANQSFVDAQVAAIDAQYALTEAFEQNGRSLDQNTESGLRNSQALYGAMEAAVAAADARYQEVLAIHGQDAAIEAANAVYQQHVGAIRAVLANLGYQESEINDIIAAYGRMPEYTETVHVRREITIYESRNIGYARRGPGGREPEYDYRWGGVRRARTGLALTQAHLATGPMVHYGEEETGGEIYIPYRGIPARNRRFVELAASWQGGQVTWPGSGGGAGGVTRQELAQMLASFANAPVNATFIVDSREIARATRSGERALAYEG